MRKKLEVGATQFPVGPNGHPRHGTQNPRYQRLARRIDTLTAAGKMDRAKANLLLGRCVMTAEELSRHIGEHCHTVQSAAECVAGLGSFVLDGYEVGAAEEIVDMVEGWGPEVWERLKAETSGIAAVSSDTGPEDGDEDDDAVEPGTMIAIVVGKGGSADLTHIACPCSGAAEVRALLSAGMRTMLKERYETTGETVLYAYQEQWGTGEVFSMDKKNDVFSIELPADGTAAADCFIAAWERAEAAVLDEKRGPTR